MSSWQALGLVGPDHFIDGMKLLVRKGTTNEHGEITSNPWRVKSWRTYRGKNSRRVTGFNSGWSLSVLDKHHHEEGSRQG